MAEPGGLEIKDIVMPTNAFTSEAEKIVNTPIPLITDKRVVPPSGDKKDFVSLSPYFWLVDGKLEQRDGQVNPATKEYPDPDKLAQVTANVYLTSLAVSQSESLPDKERFVDYTVSILKAWFVNEDTRMTPSLEFSEMKQGETDGTFYGIIRGQVLSRMVEGIKSLRDSDSLDEQTRTGVENWFRQYLGWLQKSPKGNQERVVPNNHGTFYDVQVAYIADFLGEEDLVRVTLEGAKKRIENQIEPDGKMPLEAARAIPYDYQLYNLYAFSELAVLGEKYSIDLWNWKSEDGRSLKKAFDYFSKQLDGVDHNPFKMDRAGELYLAFRAASKAYKDTGYWDLPKRFYQNPLADEVSTLKFEGE